MQALDAGDIAFRSEPRLEQYLHFAPIAGTWWPEHRARLHGPLILKACSVSFLHKHLFDNAIAVLKTTMRYTLLAQVVDATLEEQTALDWTGSSRLCQQSIS